MSDQDITKIIEYAKSLMETQTEPDIRVQVARDRMSAFIEVNLPGGCRPIVINELYEKLAQMNIRHGVDPTAVKQAYDRPGLKFPCAQGTPPQNGTDAEIRYYYSQNNKGRPAELEDGKVDFKNLNLFTIVKAGDVLAEKEPATPGIAGIDVLGLKIPSRPGKDVALLAGKNVELVDGTKVIAQIDGQLHIEKNCIHVFPSIEINGDIDLKTGNIDFIGDVIVKGSVTPGFSVKAGGTVDIQGMITGGSVEAEKLIVRHGIQGMNKGRMQIHGDVIAQFIENAEIYAEGDIIVNNVILNSRIECHNNVQLKGKQGQIIGGIIHAAHAIITYSAGRPRASATELRAGTNPTLEEEQKSLMWEILDLKQKLEEQFKTLSILKKADFHSLSEERRLTMKNTEAECSALIDRINIHNKRITEIDQLRKGLAKAKVQIAGPAYPGVSIMIGELCKQITETLHNMEFTAGKESIKMRPMNSAEQ